MIAFSGFGSSYQSNHYLQEGEWASGFITSQMDSTFGTSFIMPKGGILRNIHVLFSTLRATESEVGAVIHPFVCLAVSNSPELVYTILRDTITFTEPYLGGVEYPENTLRRGSLTNLNIEIPEGTLVAIVAGIMGENVTVDQAGTFAVSGGLYLE